MNRVVIVASRESYRTGDFLAAAALLRAEAVVASDAPPPLAEAGQIAVDLDDPPAVAATIANLVPQPDAVIAIDDQGAAVAAEASRLLGLAHNPRSAVAATRDKRLMRRLLAEAGVDQPSFRMAQPGAVPKMAAELGYPVVVKPTGLSASRGVIKANGSAAASRAERRIRDILIAAGRSRDEALLVEEYVPGSEVAVEGLLVDGRLEVMAFIDKPDPLEGPFFEETLLITPLTASTRNSRRGGRACRRGEKGARAAHRADPRRSANSPRWFTPAHRAGGQTDWRPVRPGFHVRAFERVARSHAAEKRPGVVDYRHHTGPARQRSADAPDSGNGDSQRSGRFG